MNTFSDWLFSVIPTSILSGGFVLAAFKIYGEKWLKAKFDRELENLKAEHEKDIRAIEEKHNSMLNRAAKVHENEFIVLPKAWKLVTKAFFSTGKSINNPAGIFITSDLDNKTIENTLRQNDFSDYEIDSVLKSDNKSMKVIRIERIKSAAAAHADIDKASNYLIGNGIFIRPEICDLLENMIDDMHRSVSEALVASPENAHSANQFVGPMRKNGIERIKGIEKSVRDRLWNAETYQNTGD